MGGWAMNPKFLSKPKKMRFTTICVTALSWRGFKIHGQPHAKTS